MPRPQTPKPGNSRDEGAEGTRARDLTSGPKSRVAPQVSCPAAAPRPAGQGRAARASWRDTPGRRRAAASWPPPAPPAGPNASARPLRGGARPPGGRPPPPGEAPRPRRPWGHRRGSAGPAPAAALSPGPGSASSSGSE